MVDIGVSFEYNKAEHTVQVVGIHLDKELIFKQHQVICPSHVLDCNLLRDVRFHITDLRIGNPDDDQNWFKALQKELVKAREENANLKAKAIAINCLPCPAQSVSPVVSSTSLDGDGWQWISVLLH
eukprot:964416_1